jgi:hypothetical protein
VTTGVTSPTHGPTTSGCRTTRGTVRSNAIPVVPEGDAREREHPVVARGESAEQICLIEYPCGALRVSVASGFGGLALELSAVARTRLAYERSCPPTGFHRGVAQKRCERTILRN